MNSQICVNCHNKNGINQTDNRLVTESCGHVKCMNCLLQEKSGCNACSESNGVQTENTSVDNNSSQEEAKTQLPLEVQIREVKETKKTKPERAHIKVETDANGGRFYICTVCKKKFQTRTLMYYHAYCNGQRKPFQCPDCKKSFAIKSHYKYHMRVHRNERTHSCDVCNMSFIQMSKLKRHKLKHTKEKMFSCTRCNKGFNNSTALRKHTLTHTEVRPYTCEECGTKLRDGSNYRKHMDKHKKKRWSCSICRHISETRLEAELHMQTHNTPADTGIVATGTATTADTGMETDTGVVEGAYAGTVSVVGTGVSGATDAGTSTVLVAGTGVSLSVVVATATAQWRRPLRRQHQCPRCPQAFYSRKDMRRHAAVHTDTKPYRCKLCDRRFRRKDNLERHIRNTHPKYEPATAVDCDETALKKMTNGAADIQPYISRKAYEKNEKTKLEILNPLPPLPKDVIQKHISVTTDKNNDVTSNVIDKLSILEANNARQSVIVEKRNTDVEKKVPSPENEYVHKIRKATIPLPPIDQEKFQNVKRGFLPDSMTMAPIKNVEIYKKILYEKIDKEPNEVIQNPKMHWRRKMEQDIN
ncbi:oocyte zinc finger protein XlCOF6-like isoform X1 [Colias croceus]|uniref:oocyte zinc finger protein XlCOF6-like isoform X1 n=1 Tax=Colias crocea TaxID=72248 RepID=UPI001E27C444|nr:oocyte zinc finger protein XlCOF6-like isoform X1 [Colias croceus]XP_045496498.1 oocyte zinc finger protein XlCOF6-like isoform X1 [Colias croceus]XP_045496500.1 oocyte zinc finger protein XlCOF6-like isoform X1 [Colias croceus]XP_045496501.1 oocyte zinc finger protein XlCOF6-like isoform X1 [Colias croceus]